MVGPMSEHPPTTIECPICGAPVPLTTAADPEAPRPPRLEWRCANGHSIVVELHETDSDDEDSDPCDDSPYST
jgi:hypothetical protein